MYLPKLIQPLDSLDCSCVTLKPEGGRELAWINVLSSLIGSVVNLPRLGYWFFMLINSLCTVIINYYYLLLDLSKINIISI